MANQSVDASGGESSLLSTHSITPRLTPIPTPPPHTPVCLSVCLQAADYVEKEGERAAAAVAAAAAVHPEQRVGKADLEELGLSLGGNDHDEDADEQDDNDEDDDDQPPSLGALLGETLRVALASILLDLSQARTTPRPHDAYDDQIESNLPLSHHPIHPHSPTSTQVPFLNVSVSALAGRGRLPALQTASGSGFQGYMQAWGSIVAQEGPLGLVAVRTRVRHTHPCAHRFRSNTPYHTYPYPPISRARCQCA